MPVWFGDWIKEQRVALGISQSELSDRTGKQIPQSTISMWEQRKNENPSAQNVKLLVESLGISMYNFPWEHVLFKNKNTETRCNQMTERFYLYELASASSLRTFEGKTYELKGAIGVEKESGDVRHITDLYYRTRSVISDKQLLAKRKHAHDELLRVNGIKKVK
ncbi:helix-turn-helix transcriptional regulator [Planococcus sp. ISL-109]|uniref:helix-turn-helix domain-containing protein n=1 Tax=Planococcus sp. ISL-109 TaxID=2819166 RepID=UPI001BEC3DD6|nr:helix-turn-helix transcriptional regulator [Planococcus sp. ISL-109]MBT2583139.1 helix-turn-helix transcriptional regulator [Planococcus sp. ISL-109]